MSRAVEYLEVDSPIHRLNPITKLSALACAFTITLLFSSPMVLVPVLLVISAIFVLARASSILRSYVRPLTMIGAFMLLLQLLFSHEGPEVVRFIPRGIPVLSWLGSLNQDSIRLGITMVLRMGIFGLSLPLLLATTQPRDLVLVLVDRLRFPYQYAFMFITALRFIPTLFVEVESVVQAQKARAFDPEGRGLIGKVKAYFPLVTPLVMIALKKAERLAVAMETRGYGNGPRTYLRIPGWTRTDLGLCLFCCLLVLASVSLRITGMGA